MRLLQQQLVQQDTPDTQPTALRKFRGNRTSRADKPDPVKRPRFASIQRYAQLSQNFQAVRHQSFATGLIDRRLSTVRHYNAHSLLARGDGRSKASRAAANNKYICIENCSHSFYQRSNISSEQKPGPIAANTLYVPRLPRWCASTSCKTTSTEAEERLPTCFRHSHESLRASGARSKLSSTASRTLG